MKDPKRTWPWSVLEIDATDDAREINRAYAAILKSQRPQQDADRFQALRDARSAALAGYDDQTDDEEDPIPSPHSAQRNEPPLDSTITESRAATDTDRSNFNAALPASLQAATASIQEPGMDTQQISADQLLGRLSEILINTNLESVRDGLKSWMQDPALQMFTVRRMISFAVFERLAKRYQKVNESWSLDLLTLSEVTRELEALFGWRDDELELARWLDVASIESVLRAAYPSRGRPAVHATTSTSAANDQRPASAASRWKTTLLGSLKLLIVVGSLSTIIRMCETLILDQPSLREASARYSDGDFQGAEREARIQSQKDPAAAAPHRLLVASLIRQGRLDAALNAVNEAIDTHGVKDHILFIQRSELAMEAGRFKEAAEDLERAFLRYQQAETANRLAWILATAPDDAVRDGESAVRYARSATRRDENATYVDTLAAAYAEQGQFEAAVETQNKALALFREEFESSVDRSEFTAIIRSAELRLKHYQRGKAWREPQRDSDN